MTQPKPHLLVDLSESNSDQELVKHTLDTILTWHSLAGCCEIGTILLPSQFPIQHRTTHMGWSLKPTGSPIAEANVAIESAGLSQSHLLVLLGPTIPSCDVAGTLVRAFHLDPHFGVAMPRLMDPATGGLFKLSEEFGDPEIRTVPRRALTEIPDYYLLPEILSPCLLIRDVIVANLPLLDESYESFGGAIYCYLCRVRRTGFRTVVVNRAVIPESKDSKSREVSVSKTDLRRLHAQYPDVSRSKGEIAEHSLHLHESLISRLFSPDKALRKSLLLDIRGVHSYINGTAEAILALCDGLHKLNPDWSISLLAESTSTEHHGLKDRYPRWRHLARGGGTYFTAAFRPSQPWRLSTISELHAMALLNFYAMLDTIAWDILFEAPRGLGPAWDFMCQHADGILYNSHYTRDHMLRRFPLARSGRNFVFHHSFHPRDYAPKIEEEMASPEQYILLVGNSYDHKHLDPTVDLLRQAFPYQHLKVFGSRRTSSSTIEVLESGNVPASDVAKLFVRAKLIVFPSFYEGFGFPILTGLAHGRIVIARRSELLNEIASNYRGPGKLVAFSTPLDLIEAVGRALHNCPFEGMPLGSALAPDQEPKSWTDIAQGVLSFVEERLAKPDLPHWAQRDRAIRQLNTLAF